MEDLEQKTPEDYLSCKDMLSRCLSTSWLIKQFINTLCVLPDVICPAVLALACAEETSPHVAMKLLPYFHLKGWITACCSGWNPELSCQMSTIELYATSSHKTKPDQALGMLSQIILSASLGRVLELLLTPEPTNNLQQTERSLSLSPQMQLWLMRNNAQIFNHKTSNS